jgi:hypothetical protein
MTRNWYELSISELEAKKARMLEWIFRADRNDPDQKKVWRAMGEIADVLETKKQAEDDPFIKDVIEALCL